MVRKHIALALATAFLTICFGCADELNSPVATDEAPVLPPTNVQAIALNGGHVELTWQPSSQPDISGYNVYRRLAGSGNPHKLNAARIQANQYRDDSSLRRTQYEYRVTAVNSNGKESRHTSVYIVTRDPLEDGKAPDRISD